MKKRKYKYGSVIKLSGNRLNPYGARITIGYNVNGYPVYYFLGFFEEELDAHICLRDYNNTPYNIYVKEEIYNKVIKFIELPSKILIKNNNIDLTDRTNYTFKQVYEEYAKLNFPTKDEIALERETHMKAKGKFTSDTMYVRKSAFKQAETLHNIPYVNLRTVDFQQVINCATSPKKAKRLRYLFLELDDYAEQKDIISKTYAKHVNKIDFNFENTKPRLPFTNEEIEMIWKDKTNTQDEALVRDICLILLYTGMRIEELLFMFTKNIDLKEDYMRGGLKTNSGKNRVIPIHHLIKPIIKKHYNSKNEFLFMYGDKRLPYAKYRVMFNNYMAKLNIQHTSHDARHTVESELDRRQVRTVTKDLIMGHKNGGTGEKVYTHKTLQELKESIELISYKERELIYLVSNS
nr:MAG TPA: Integrase [Caudoviricetes sp.]